MEDRIEQLRRWIDSLKSNLGALGTHERVHVIELRIDEGIADSKLLTNRLKASIRSQWRSISGDVGDQKGIYVWFWPSANGHQAWPLYVGKSQRGRSCFRSRALSHLKHAELGVDSLYHWKKSIGKRELHVTHAASSPVSPSRHAEKIRAQCDGMRILTLSMDEDDARVLAADAEALVLAAILQIHGAELPMRSDDHAWKKVMNSFGRTGSMGALEPLWQEAFYAISACLARDPSASIDGA